MELPYVLECGVTAAPDEIRGQVVKACIVLVKDKEGSDELKKEIQNFVKSAPPLQVPPPIVEFRTELPKTTTARSSGASFKTQARPRRNGPRGQEETNHDDNADRTRPLRLITRRGRLGRRDGSPIKVKTGCKSVREMMQERAGFQTPTSSVLQNPGVGPLMNTRRRTFRSTWPAPSSTASSRTWRRVSALPLKKDVSIRFLEEAD
jgi:hypothetical protein